jgi:hypothetical protein
MSSGKIKQVFHEIQEESRETVSEFQLNFSKTIISFSIFFKKSPLEDIYTGDEKIPFSKRDKEFKAILKQEFRE